MVDKLLSLLDVGRCIETKVLGYTQLRLACGRAVPRSKISSDKQKTAKIKAFYTSAVIALG